ncbi:penicillin acylase family protein [Bermanella marisrubri]|uniref:Penicillin amidase family protein n=1 Tax=Bermanella marisrubri TaxID=207949 RepID=Q1N024_9GAMM|nr:penicillin acylase family protein [Bermanella marisrubri]EAT11539.1 penicillin amidase family protein [Oceanobacter sp. RED65] [Bermanella marisrubri]QIZ84996.1 penicillin acylase family protein [Bermanella marisrubri]
MSLARVLKASAFIFPIIILLLAFVAYQVLSDSQALLEGELQTEVQSQVIIDRDAQGIPTLKGERRIDVAYGLGFLHAQERFFQMDLLRRNSAGELSELFGEVTTEFDKKMRLHQFRKRAQKAVDALPDAHKRVLEAYTKGVNKGLTSLESLPFEYHLVSAEAEPWLHADSALVLISMYIDLQPEWSQSERSLAVMRDLLPTDWFKFLTSQGGYWDAPLHGQALTENRVIPQQPLSWFEEQANKSEQISNYQFFDQIHYGSNNWSVSGALTEHGAGMVADDMHLKLRAPNIWYRASWYLEDGRRITGASLPGTPAIVVGSNEKVAWGFTNSQGDYHDVIVLKTNEDQSQYLTAEGYKSFSVESEVVEIKGQESQTVAVKLTQWGPVIGENQKGELLAQRWVVHDVEGINFRLMDMENAQTVEDALLIAAEAGVPGQNLNVVDSEGNQAWTIMGRLPKRFGFSTGMGEKFDGSQLPQDWSKGDKGWAGYLEPEDYPKVVNPQDGRIWTANARIVSDELLEKVGTRNYALGARQQQIRGDMYALESFTEQDFLDIQMDHRAVFLERWHELLFSLIKDDPNYNEVQSVLKNWGACACADSTGYLLVKRFREAVVDQTVGSIYRYIDGNSNEFWVSAVDNFIEYPVWQMVTEKPEQHIPRGADSWQDFLMTTLDTTVAKLTENGRALDEVTWGDANTLAIQHPLSKAIPGLGWLLDMPAESMNGDTYMPLVQKPSSGASQRMAVAPGYEEQGIFHMATGQSGHPLSPYYDKGHRDWVEGSASAFLPGETQWTLKLVPSSH